jgi:hypothetical protein
VDHKAVTADTLHELTEQVRALGARCREHGIPVPVSFAYPGNGIHPKALPLLGELGIRFARRGGSPEYPYKEGRGWAYEPGLDHPLLIPSAGDVRPAWTLQDFEQAVQQAGHGRIAVLQFHGVPDTAHSWVTTSQVQFEGYLRYLAEHRYQVIALRDLAKYVDPDLVPQNAWGIIEDRQRLLAAGKTADNYRRPKDEDDLRSWLENMVVYHEFTPSEAGAALGLSAEEVVTALRRFKIPRVRHLVREANQPLLVLPYPGGRHPRIGFLDGALRPQRETKISVFTPWNDGGYVVVDVPEAIWFQESGQRKLLYLAHTHVPTLWDKQSIALEPLEWKRQTGGVLEVERQLPNRVAFGTKVVPERQGVRLELWLTNGTNEKLTDLRVQMCVLPKAARGFEQRKTRSSPSRSRPAGRRLASVGSSRPVSRVRACGPMRPARVCTLTHRFPTALRAKPSGSMVGYRSMKGTMSRGSCGDCSRSFSTRKGQSESADQARTAVRHENRHGEPNHGERSGAAS